MKQYISIASELENLEKITHWLNEKLPSDMKESQKSVITLLTQELVTNSILHGNKQIASKQVFITLGTQGELVFLSIRDEGEGIPPLPSTEEATHMDYLEENGRGLKLAVLLANEIEIDKNEIKLYFDKRKQTKDLK